jgi:transcription elongation GreA/GreB family factor
MREEFEKLVTAGKIKSADVDVLLTLTDAGYCMHKSWGFGRITTVDTVFSRFTIDFEGKPGHSMDLGFGSSSLKPIPKDHILARKASDLAALQQMAALHHLDLIKVVLQSYGGKATLDQVQTVLVPDVIAEDWKKWWETAKREMKKDGHYQLPIKKSNPIIFHDEEITEQSRLLKEFNSAKGLKARIPVVIEMEKSVGDLEDPKGTATEVITTLNTDISKHESIKPALALEAIFSRDDLAKAAGLDPQEGEVSVVAIWAEEMKLDEFVAQFPAAKQRRVLSSFKENNEDSWADPILQILNGGTTKLTGECALLLIQNDKLEQLKGTLSQLINQHTATTETMLWLAKERNDNYADILGPEVFRAMMSAIEYDQFREKRSNKLPDFIVDDRTLLLELIESADIEIIKDLTRALKMSPCFGEMDKNSLLARIVKRYPAVQAIISTGAVKHETSLIVSWESLTRRKAEYDDLVSKQIPDNAKELAIARSYGDLRENHEYKAAKERRTFLSTRKAELERDLDAAQATDFANPDTGSVNIGTHVSVTNLADNIAEKFTILGAWDGDPDNGFISYLTPLGQSLVGAKAGEEVSFEIGGEEKKYRIDSIAAYTPPPSVSAPAVEEEAPIAEEVPIAEEPEADSTAAAN